MSLSNARIDLWRTGWKSQAAADNEWSHFACPELVIAGVNMQVSYCQPDDDTRTFSLRCVKAIMKFKNTHEIPSGIRSQELQT